MHSIPWVADLEELSTLELSFLGVGVIIACLATGFVVDLIMRDSGLGVVVNGIVALIGVCGGIYLRYRLFAPYRADDLFLTIGVAVGAAVLAFIALGVAKSQIS